MSRNRAELFVDTDLNYIPFVESSEKFTPNNSNIYYFESETTPNAISTYIVTDEIGGLYNPIANCALSKSSSTESDACSSTRLLDSIPEDRMTDSLRTTIGDIKFEKTTKDDCETKSTTANADFDYGVWTKIQSSMTNSLRKTYLKKSATHREKHRGFIWRSFCSIERNKLSLLLFLTLLVCAFVILVIGVLTVKSYHSLRHVKSDANDDDDQYLNQTDDWWKSGIFYEIFPASFKDSNGDGFGDLDGIRQQISYLRELGVTVLRLNSIFSALDYPYQYEHVIDFKNVDPHIGSLHNFKALVFELHKHGMYIVLDINPTVTSDQHPWAAHWLINSTGKYSNFFVHNKNITIESTSSTAIDRKTSEMEETHLSFGGHLYLNWSHFAVERNMLECMRFWVQTGVDGFFLKNLEQIKIDDRFPETLFRILDNIRDVLNDRSPSSSDNAISQSNEKTDESRRRKRVLIASRQSLQRLSARIQQQLTTRYFTYKNKSTETFDRFQEHKSNNHQNRDVFSHFDLIESFLEINLNKTENIREQVNSVFLNNHNSEYWMLWSIGSATTSRLASRIGNDYVAAATFLLTMLPGSINILYGDEIGLKDSVDPQTNKEYRGGQLCPMLWEPTANGNFSSSNTTSLWMPLNSNYMKINVKRQPESVSRLQHLINFRKNNFIVKAIKKHGNYLFHYINDGEIVFERYFSNVTNDGIITRERFVLFANLGSEVRVKSFLAKFHFVNIEIASNPNRLTQFLYIGSLRLDPGEAIIARLV